MLNHTYLTLSTKASYIQESHSSLSPYGTKIKTQAIGKVMPIKEPLEQSNTSVFLLWDQCFQNNPDI